ncbi:MAG: alpha-amylase family protein [bacterium]
MIMRKGNIEMQSIGLTNASKYPFIYGVQYYRAPTPEEQFWRKDLQRISECGFNMVKFWAQWRWVHRKPETFFFDDLDELMALADEYKLKVTINLIFDVAPAWIFNAYPDCRMVEASGRAVEPCAAICRQIGGYPGPCYNHSYARSAREEFLKQVVARYAGCRAMSMWDVWNEPESCFLFRQPHESTLLCYCDNCRSRFKEWLRMRYGSLEGLNEVWGRCYNNWDELELPRVRNTFTDMIDWRLFHLDTLGAEARRRISTVKSIDNRHPVYLHPVPNVLYPFNPVTGVDDFQIADGCDCFGGTTNGVPAETLQTVAAAQGRVSYNVESHLCAGAASMYSRLLTVQDFADNFLPQIGLGIRGFLHWQYRGESLGAEAPAWGLLDVNGREGASHAGAVDFWKKLRPVAKRIMEAPLEPPAVAVFKSCSNEIFQWCMNGNFDDLHKGITGYTQLLYRKNLRLTYVNDRMLIDGLPASIKLLIMPNCYAMQQPVAEALSEWVLNGGTLICEAHTGGYNLSTGRHSRDLPGLGLAEAFGIRERNAVAVAHLGLSKADIPIDNLPPDLAKAFDAFDLGGEQILPLKTIDDKIIWGWSRYTELEGSDLQPIASLSGSSPCIASKKAGSGSVYYFGTLAGQMWDKGGALADIIDSALKAAGVPPSNEIWPGLPEGVRLDPLKTPYGTAVIISNRTDKHIKFQLRLEEPMYSIFTECKLSGQAQLGLNPGQAELLAPDKWDIAK